MTANKTPASDVSEMLERRASAIGDEFYEIPESQAGERQIALLLFILTCAYLSLFRRYTTMDPDEGIVLQGAQRILQGQVLYRDFFSFFTPGSYYLLALLFKIFGDSFLVARTALVLFGGAYSVVTYLLARRVCTRGSALLVAAIVSLTTLPYRFLVLHNWDSTLWASLALYCAIRWVESPRWKWALATGSFASLTFLFEQSKGAGLWLGLAVGFLANAWTGWRQQGQLSGCRAKQLLGFTLGFVWPLLITCAYFGVQHGLRVMLADWFWPLQHYSMANRVPYGYQNWSDSARHLLFETGPWWARVLTVVILSPCLLIPALPVIAIGILVYWFVLGRHRRGPREKCAYYVLICAALSGLLLSVVIVRADIVHFMYLQPLFGLVLAWIVDGRDIPGPWFRSMKSTVTAYVAVAFLGLAIPLIMRALNAPEKLVTRRGVIAVPKKDTVIDYVQAHVSPGETVLVYPYLPLYYYLTGTFAPTRYEYLQPGMNTPQQSLEMISELASGRVQVILFESSFWEKIPNSWPGTPLSAIAHDPVADYILRSFHTCKLLQSPSDWQFEFMVRKDSECR